MNVDEPKFTAYALNALPIAEKESVEPMALADGELWREAEKIAAFAEKLKSALRAETNARLSAAHWREIYAEAGVEETAGIIPLEPVPPKRFPVWAVSAAAGVMLGAVVASLAITWNDRPVLLAGTPNVAPATRGATKVEHGYVPENVVPDASPRIDSAAKPDAPAPQAAISIPRPGAPPVVASDPASPRSLAIFVKARLVNSNGDLVTHDDEVEEEVDELPLPDLAPGRMVSTDIPSGLAIQERAASSLPTWIDPAGADNSSSRPILIFPPRAVGSSPSNTTISKPSITGPTDRVSKPVASTTSAVPKSTPVSSTLKQQGSTVSAPISEVAWRRPAGTSTNRPRSTAIASVMAGNGGTGTEFSAAMMLDTFRFGTLDELNSILVRDSSFVSIFSPAGSALQVGNRVPFEFRGNPEVKVDVLLESGALPAGLIPGNTRVLDISAPYLVSPNP